MQTHELGFTFSVGMGFHHVDNSLFLGGGTDYVKYFSKFRKVLPSGRVTELQKMKIPKFIFAMAFWKESNSLFTLGGCNKHGLNEVEEFLPSKNRWTSHSRLPEASYGSSAVVLNSVIYVIGGDPSSHSAMWCSLAYDAPFMWKFMDLPNYNFQRYWCREAFVVGKSIVYFVSNYRETFL